MYQPSRKSSVDEIRTRFDNDVERFSNLETGQSATIDAPLAMDLVTAAAAAVTPHAKSVVDVGCGAGNYSLKMLQRLPGLSFTLIDLSQPMLTRAAERLTAAGCQSLQTIQADVREVDLPPGETDIILAAAVLHHLRTPSEWEQVFTKFFRALRPGGSLWIFDLVQSDLPGVQRIMWERYGEYLTAFRGAEYRDAVFQYIAQEDTPQSLAFQLELLRKVGFQATEVLHKNGCFAAFGAVK